MSKATYSLGITTKCVRRSGVDGGVLGAKAAKLVATDRVCVSTFVNVTSLDIFKESWRQFPAMFVATKPDVSKETSGHFQPCLVRPNQAL